MQSRSAARIPARSSARHVASRASEAPVSPSDTQWRGLIPPRRAIPSSAGGILRGRGDGRRFRPRPARWQGLMELTVTRAQYDAVRGARHLPDVLKKVLDGATRAGDGYRLHLTYEEATALNELCAWNVHTDASGAMSPESK